ncbi:MAG: hypothetical protein Q4F97_07090 [Bacteroidales bacterium]|nr:hypothetical protein [Bacteroidales bacterium]
MYRNLVNQNNGYIHEKVYTMTDRGYYYAGDIVWLRSFIVDAATNRLLNSSIYNYIDLIDWRTRKTVRSVVVRRSDNDIYKGYIALDDTLMSGKYLLKSYTKYQLSDNRANCLFYNNDIGRYADLLMMLEEWTSYNIDRALKGEIEKPMMSFESKHPLISMNRE